MTSSVNVTTPSAREIVIARQFDAPAQTIFDFHTKPELVQKWLLGPPGWTMPICTIDLRAGGQYRYLWRSQDGENEFGVSGEYREITAPQRLVHTETMDGAPGKALCTLTFAESGGRTTLTTAMFFDTAAERDRALQSGMTEGMSQSYDRMESLIAR